MMPIDVQIEKIIRTKRRHSFAVTDDAKLIVRAPLTDDETIAEIVSNTDVGRKKKKSLTRNQNFPKEFVNGEGFLYLGRYYKLNIVEDQSEPLKLEGAFYLSRYALRMRKKYLYSGIKTKPLKKFPKGSISTPRN